MQELINVAVNNGLGIASFLALLYFIYKYICELNDTLNKINESMIEVQIAMVKLAERISDIKSKGKRKNEKKEE